MRKGQNLVDFLMINTLVMIMMVETHKIELHVTKKSDCLRGII